MYPRHTPVAQCHLGLCHEHGTGIAQDHAEAARWCRMDAVEGEWSRTTLRSCVQLAQAWRQDHTEAIQWCCKAAE